MRDNSSNTTAWIVRLMLELVVVFIGVYAAFALSQHEASKQVDERRRQLQEALVREIKDLTSNTRRVARQVPAELAQFDSAVRSGRRPPLVPWMEPVRVQTHMWDVTLQSGALDLFSIPTIHNLSEFYNELNAGFEQISQLRTLSENVLIPNIDRGSSEFYTPDGLHLRTKYQWYRDGLGRLARLATSITAMGDSLTAELGSEYAHHASQITIG
jgi:hypothetical protein